MATQKRISELITRLVDQGRVYYLQPTVDLARTLSRESAKWRTYRDGVMYPWGDGPNEGLDQLIAHARAQIYGRGDVSAELLQELKTTEDRVYYQALLSGCRSGESPWYVSPDLLYEWIMARRYGGLADYDPSTTDGRDLKRRSENWAALAPHGTSVHDVERLSIEVTYAEDGVHRIGGQQLSHDTQETGARLLRIVDVLNAGIAHSRHMTIGQLVNRRMERRQIAARINPVESDLLTLPRGTAVEIVSLAALGVPWAAAKEVIQYKRHYGDETATLAVYSQSRETGEWIYLYRLHEVDGRVVPRSVVVSPERQTLEQIRSEPNPEIRRMRIERYAGWGKSPLTGKDITPTDGWRRYLTECDPVIVDCASDDIEVTRMMLQETGDPFRCLVATCPTGRIFALSVPPDTDKCESAQLWLRGGAGPKYVSFSRMTFEVALKRCIGAS